MRAVRGAVMAVALGAVGPAAVLVRGPAAARADAASGNCAWQAHFDPAVVNVAYPDQAANYFTSVIPGVPGARLRITGRYPHARYISFTSYDGRTAAVDNVNDQGIDPDAGGTDVFDAGAARTVADAQRHYTVYAVFGQRPQTGVPRNTFYTTSADGSHSANYFEIIYRIYRTDRGLDITGGEPLPDVAYLAPDGSATPIPVCPQPSAPPNDVNGTVAGMDSPGYPPNVTPGANPPVWHKFFNLATSVAQAASDSSALSAGAGDVQPTTMSTGSGGFLQNLDNQYIFSVLGAGYGQVVVLHARAPTFPRTYDAEPVMGSGQVRYWSMCSNEQFSQRFYACLTDDQAILDAEGDYTIVVSTAGNRPVNAVDSCRVNWLPFGPAIDNVLIVRNMLADPSFTGSIQHARTGHVADDMGAYYPGGAYMSRSDFERRGCPADRAAAAGAVQAVSTGGPGLVNTSAGAPAGGSLPAMLALTTGLGVLGVRRRRAR